MAPSACPALKADETEYLDILRELRRIPGIKKVFIRSGIRYDFMLKDKNNDFFKELVKYHISGQLKVAPEHCSAAVLDKMGKPHIDAYIEFSKKYFDYTKRIGKEQYLVPYLMSSHPGATLKDAVKLAEFIKKNIYTQSRCRIIIPLREQFQLQCFIRNLTRIHLSLCMWRKIRMIRPCKEH